ncbi:MAG: MerR family transcriptional regulator [Deltaproteobacteria bacterium]|nr:MerR family transcriptional regulator [Deltaproteobacteria bacterium]
MNDPDRYTIEDLAVLAGETTRTIRYYTQEGLLASPGLGRGVRYGPEHLDRLLLIQSLQELKMPLSDIRERLRDLAPEEIRALLVSTRQEVEAQKQSGTGQRESAAEYAERLLAVRTQETALKQGTSAPARSSAVLTEPDLPAPVPWDRYVLTQDVEIHVRRPLSPPDQRRLRKLVRFGRELFDPMAGIQAVLFPDPSGDPEP